MGPSGDFEQSVANGQWLPPRRRLANVLLPGYTTGKWYEYNDWRVREVDGPNLARKVHYRTYSFYHNEGAIWIYPSDATRHRVGECGDLENRRIRGRHVGLEDDDSSSDDDDSFDRHTENWVPLRFSAVAGDSTLTSKATTRGLGQRILFQRPDQTSLHELLPNQYLAPRQDWRAAPGYGGLVGELPILIALVAYSVPPHGVSTKLAECIRQGYRPHGRRRGEGCKCKPSLLQRNVDHLAGTERRGLVVRVYYETTNQSQGGPSARALERERSLMGLIENGSCGKFVS